MARCSYCSCELESQFITVSYHNGRQFTIPPLYFCNTYHLIRFFNQLVDQKENS